MLQSKGLSRVFSNTTVLKHQFFSVQPSLIVQLSHPSVQFSCSVVSDSLQPHGLQHTRLPCPSPTPGACSSSCPLSQVMPSNHLILCHPLFLLPSIFPSIRVFSNESVFQIRWPKYWSFSFSISPSDEYSGLSSPYSPRDSQESSPAPQFESINSLVLSILYGATLTSVHNYWKNHSFDYIDLCRQSDISDFYYAVYVCHSFLPSSRYLLISWLQ